ncbi:MAG: hybrid sensor histidine kinase/response regulator [Magnetococcus sp. MYC-9]
MKSETAKILIVDDEASNIDLLVNLLQAEYKLVIAKNGQQALQRVHVQPRPDLILLDIIMPGMDGFEVCQQLQAQAETAGIPVIFITGKDTPQDETRGLEVGAVDFIRKPFHPAVTLARIRTHLALQRQKSRLMELNEMKNRFLGMAAHDLRSPLASIAGISELLLSLSMPDEERQEMTRILSNLATQMLDLINDLLDVSVIESGTFALATQPGNLSTLVAERLQLQRWSAEKKSIRFHSDLQATLTTHFDPARMQQVIDNLLSNAIKFTPPNTTITVRTGHRDSRSFLQVADQGPGIPDGERHRLFGAFQKLGTPPTGQEKGTGLGLSIVKKIMDAHQGEIHVENTPGQGATFTCWLPHGQSVDPASLTAGRDRPLFA